jgi:hypothetical protein
MKTWKDYPRKTDKVAIVGFHEKTRDKAPFDDPSYEIWTLNEEYNYPWVKRFDRHFQLHPRWDFTRTNNLNDPNHFLWLQSKTGTCIFCKGVAPKGKPCAFCDNGLYDPKKHNRKNVPIYMQKAWKDIPGSVELPLKEITAKFIPGKKPYYTSSVAYMIGLAMLMEFKEIEFYGFDMGTKTEYHYQRANFEYWIGLAHGLGYKVSLPGSEILTGKLYGYENMHIGYRQQLEMRDHSLASQLAQVKTEVLRLEAQYDLLKSLHESHPDLEEQRKALKVKLQKKQALVNFINGAKMETDNLTKLYENYMVPSPTEEGIDHPAYEENTLHVGVRYTESD